MSNIKRNFIMQSLYRLLRVLTPLISAPYVSRVLGADNLGVFSYTYSIACLFIEFCMMGIDSYGNRAVARSRDNSVALDYVISEILYLHIIISIICVVLYFLFIQTMIPLYRVQAEILGILVLSALFDISWIFFGLEKFQLVVILDIATKIGSTLLIFLCVKTKADLWKYTVIMAEMPFFSQFVLFICAFKKFSARKVHIKQILYHLKPISVLFFSDIASSIYRMMDKLMLGYFGFVSQLGCYENADKSVRIPIGLITSLGVVMLPQISNLYSKKDYQTAEKYMAQSVKFVFYMASAMMFGMAAVSSDFVLVLFGGEFEYSGILLTILSASVLFMAWNDLICTQYLIPLGYDKVYMVAVWAGAIVNLILNCLLIPQYNAIGAAIATDLSYLTVAIFQTAPIAKRIPLASFLRQSFTPISIGIVMFVCVKCVAHYTSSSVPTLLLEILCGVVVYLTLSAYSLKRK